MKVDISSFVRKSVIKVNCCCDEDCDSLLYSNTNLPERVVNMNAISAVHLSIYLGIRKKAFLQIYLLKSTKTKKNSLPQNLN